MSVGFTHPGTQSPPFRRVKVTSVNADATEVVVRDGNGWTTRLDGTLRPKGTGLPEENEVWLIERFGPAWLLRAQEKAGGVDLGADLNALIAEEVARKLAEAAEAESDLRDQEAALAAGILGGSAVVLIQDTEPTSEYQNENTLWIDTAFDRDRPMRWSVVDNQWIAVVDQIAMEAARRAVEAQEAAEAASAEAAAAQAAADAVAGTADSALDKAEEALAAAAGKGRVIYGDPATTPGEEHSLLIGPGNRLYIWSTVSVPPQWIPVPDSQLAALQNLIDGLQDELDAQAQTLTDVQGELSGVQGLIDGKSTIYPIGSNPTLGPEDAGDMRLMADGGVEYWDGTQWLPADPRVAEAVLSAAEALDLANTKSTTYFKATEPTPADIEPPETAFRTNDFWVRTGDNRLHRWDGDSWEEIKDAAITAVETAIVDVQGDLVGLSGRVDGKSTIYVQETAPVDVGGAEDTGDIWIDTAGGGRVYKVWDGDSWELADDSRIEDILADLTTKTTTYYAETEPLLANHDLNVGDLWVRDSDNRLHRWSGGAWVDISDQRFAEIATALSDVQAQFTTLDGKIDGKAVVYVQTADPSAGASPAWGTDQLGDIWINTTGGTTVYQVWDGDSWTTITDPVAQEALAGLDETVTTYFAAGTTEPTGTGFPPATGYHEGDLWVRASDKRLFRYDGSTWADMTFIDPAVAAQATAITDLQGDLSGLATQVDGKAVIWYQPAAPTGLTTADKGDIWIDSDASPKKFQSWSGTGWVDITDQFAIDTLAKVNTKTTTYRATALASPLRPNITPPTGGFTTGDLWVNSADNKVYRYDGSVWVDMTYVDPRVGQQATAIANLQAGYTTLDGKIDGKATTWFQPDDPSVGASPAWGVQQTGDFWVDSDAVPKTYKVWDGDSWVDVTDATAITALERVNRKITTYYGATEPTAPTEGFTEGDLWLDDRNILHRWDDTANLWVTVQDQDLVDLQVTVTEQGDYIADLETDLFTNVIPGLQTDITTAGGVFTGSVNAPTPADGTGKPLGAIWNQYDGNELIGSWYWTGSIWSPRAPQKIHIDEMTYGEVDGIRVKANSILTKALAVGDFENHLDNPNTDVGVPGWNVNPIAVTGNPVGSTGALQLLADGTEQHLTNKWVPVKPDDEFRLTAMIRRVDEGTGLLAPINIGVSSMDAAGVITGPVAANTTYRDSPLLPVGQWVSVSGTGVVPAGAVALRLDVWITPAYLTGTLEFTGFEMRRRKSGVEIRDGSVFAEHLEATLTLSSRIVSGDPIGAAAEMSPNGFEVYHQDTEVGRYVSTRLTGTGDSLAILDAAGAMLGGIDEEGVVSGIGGNFNTDITVAGRDLLGLVGVPSDEVTYDSPTGWLDSLTRNSPGAAQLVKGINWDGTTAEQPFMEVMTTIEAGRVYLVFLWFRVMGSVGATDNRVRARIRKTEIDLPNNGVLPAQPTITSPVFQDVHDTPHSAGYANHTAMFFFTPSRSEIARWLVTYQATGNATGVRHGRTIIAFADITNREGNTLTPLDRTVVATVPPSRTYKTTWRLDETPSSNRSASYQVSGSGEQYGSQPYGSVRSGWMSGLSWGSYRGLMAFTGTGVEGDDRGRTITQALSGKTLKKVEVEMTCRDAAGGTRTVRLGYGSGTSVSESTSNLTPNQKQVSGWAAGTKKTVTFNEAIPTIKAGGRVIMIDGTTTTNFLTMHGMRASTSQRPKLILTYEG